MKRQRHAVDRSVIVELDEVDTQLRTAEANAGKVFSGATLLSPRWAMTSTRFSAMC